MTETLFTPFDVFRQPCARRHAKGAKDGLERFDLPSIPNPLAAVSPHVAAAARQLWTLQLPPLALPCGLQLISMKKAQSAVICTTIRNQESGGNL
jgi:hypothetical protein